MEEIGPSSWYGENFNWKWFIGRRWRILAPWYHKKWLVHSDNPFVLQWWFDSCLKCKEKHHFCILKQLNLPYLFFYGNRFIIIWSIRMENTTTKNKQVKLFHKLDSTNNASRKPESIHKMRFLNYILSIVIGILVYSLKRQEEKYRIMLGVLSSVLAYLGNKRVLRWVCEEWSGNWSYWCLYII